MPNSYLAVALWVESEMGMQATQGSSATENLLWAGKGQGQVDYKAAPQQARIKLLLQDIE